MKVATGGTTMKIVNGGKNMTNMKNTNKFKENMNKKLIIEGITNIIAVILIISFLFYVIFHVINLFTVKEKKHLYSTNASYRKRRSNNIHWHLQILH